jgi:hypothetical protein
VHLLALFRAIQGKKLKFGQHRQLQGGCPSRRAIINLAGEVNKRHKNHAARMVTATLIPLAVLLVITLKISAANVDPDTLAADRVRTRRRDGRTMTLRMSDEFGTNDRSFSKGDDPHFEAIHKPDYTNEAIQFCKYALHLI